ncbi:MAG: hypothetical protein KC420_03370, partial [Myxococcales bacterium]|nr:hypothetical protein [Myxococcales bacterium]
TPLVTLALACSGGAPPPEKQAPPEPAKTEPEPPKVEEPPPPPPPLFLDQGWDDAMRAKFYYTTQGSFLLPYAWFLALEHPTAESLLRDDVYFESLRFIPDPDTHGGLNPDGLPIGFTRQVDAEGKPWLGMTCAACHTGQITHKGQAIRIDGAPALANLSLLLGDTILAMEKTLGDEGRFDRFALRVLGEGADPAAKSALRADLERELERFPRPSEPNPGFGRQDAFGAILNQLTSRELGVPDNFRPEDAPVSYPHLWLTPHLAWVQWIGLAENPIARNIGEVLGVYGHVDLTSEDESKRFASTAEVRNLYALEQWVADLSAPKWPEALGPIDEAKAARGKEIYEAKGRCSSCHPLAPFPRTDPKKNRFGKDFVKITMVPIDKIGTDPKVITNALTRKAKTGALKKLFKGKDEVLAVEILLLSAGAIFKREAAALGLSEEEQVAYAGFRVPGQDAPNLKAYKARPLDGIWATAPFLHNGSVPSLAELLKAPADRVKTFHVGSREYDPVNVGFVTDAGEGTFLFDTSQEGNANVGHDYSGDLSEEDRGALLEFLKTI